MRQVLFHLALATGLSACASFPDLEGAVSAEARRAAYPDLVPTASLLSRRSLGRLSEKDGEILLARAQRLRARARILNSLPTINEDMRLRVADRLRRLGG